MRQIIKTLWQDRFIRLISMIALISMSVWSSILILGLENILDNIELLQDTARQSYFLTSFIIFGISYLTFLTVAPLGTIIVLISGSLIGVAAGLWQFAALMAASLTLYMVSDVTKRKSAVQELLTHPRISKVVLACRNRGLFLTIFLRLVPVVPSAVCTLACSGLNVPLRKFLLGSLVSGWVRPVFFAFIASGLNIDLVRDQFLS